LIESSHSRQCLATNSAPQSAGSVTDVLSPSARTAKCNLYVSTLPQAEGWKIKKVSGKSGNRCCDSQWEICPPINQQKYALAVYSWCTRIQAVRTRTVFLSFCVLHVSSHVVPLLLKYKVLKNTQLPYRVYRCILAICPIWSLKSKKWSNSGERVYHKAPVVHTVTVSFFSSSAQAVKFLTTIMKKTNHFPNPCLKPSCSEKDDILISSAVTETCLKLFRDSVWLVSYKEKLGQPILWLPVDL